MFPDIEYIDWVVGRPERTDHDLGSSDLYRARRPGCGGPARERGVLVVPGRFSDAPDPSESARIKHPR